MAGRRFADMPDWFIAVWLAVFAVALVLRGATTDDPDRDKPSNPGR